VPNQSQRAHLIALMYKHLFYTPKQHYSAVDGLVFGVLVFPFKGENTKTPNAIKKHL
jgi:hypothetical protein